MIIKCGRCGKEIKNPNKYNAKYIINPNDDKTYGKSLVTKFSVIDEVDATKVEFRDFGSAKDHLDKKHKTLDNSISSYEKKRDEHLANIEKMRKSLGQLSKNGDAIEEVKEKESEIIKKEQAVVGIEEEIKNIHLKKAKIRIVEEVAEEIVPKTLIICPNCLRDDDTVIW